MQIASLSTLTAAPLAPLLDRLFAENEAAPPGSSPFLAKLTPAERVRIIRSRTDYRRFYDELRELPLAVSRETGTLLYMLVRSAGARAIVEFGASFGVSTLCLAAGLRDNGGGQLITTEFEPSKAARARANLAAGGLADLVELRQGDALQTLASDLPAAVDLLLLDGAKALYPDILDLIEGRLRPGALVIADNATFNPDYLARMRDPARGYLTVPLGSEVELSIRLG